MQVSPGQKLLLVVGEGGQGARNMSKAAFGFGGAAYKEGGGGAGLSGSVFIQTTYEYAL